MAIYRGVKYFKDLQIKTRSDGQPVDISAWQFSGDLTDGAGTTVLPMSTGGGHFTVIDGENGWLRFALTTAQTQALEAGPVTFGLYRTDESDGPSRLARCAEQVREQD